MIDKFRQVRYTDDGCYLYQCLSCYKELEIRYIPNWKFCPMCGIEYSGELECRPSHEPSWLWKLDLPENKRYELNKKCWKKDKAVWVIEERTVWWNVIDGELIYKYYREHPGATDWGVYQRYDKGQKTALSILKDLKYLRQSYGITTTTTSFGSFKEYRAKIC